MATKKEKPLDDDAVLAMVEEKVRKAVGYFDSKLSKERERVINYYNSKLPWRQNEGKSSYISTDVYDSVESMKAQLLETFSGNPDNLISFPALHQQDAEACRVATEYCTYQLFNLNDGHGLCHDTLHNGFTARAGVVKVYWDKRHEDTEEEFDGLAEQDVHALAAQDDIVALDAEQAEDGSGAFHGNLLRREDHSQVAVEVMPPEEFLIEQRAPSIKKSGLCTHRTLKTRAELKREGYDRKVIDEINWADARSLDLSGETISRNDPVADGTAPIDDSIQPEMQKVMVYESYVRMDMRDGKGAKLWKICHAGNRVLEREEVDRAPFIAFVPLRVPHVFYGNNFGQRVISTQNARTVLTRGILDHTATTTNPRWGVVKGGVLKPDEMKDNRLGGIVNLTRPDAIVPFPMPTLNPFVFQTIDMLKQNKEESTGISALSQGLDKNAISTQNSAALVDNLVSISGQRQKVIARNFAKFLVEVYLETYRLVLLNEKRQKIIEVAGNFTNINVDTWVERKTCRVAVHLGYGEMDQQAGAIASAYVQMSEDPGLGNLFSDQNRYAMVTDAMRKRRMENWSNYLTSPDKAPPKQPDPLKVKELGIKDTAAQASMVTAQASALKNEKQAEITSYKEMLSELKAHMDALFRTQESRRMDVETASRVNVAQREAAVREREVAVQEQHPPHQSKAPA